MITKFENVTMKSFENYTCENELKKINVLFGKNGSGKSALSMWIRDQQGEGLKIFNTDYVNTNIKITEEEEINGVKLTVGAQKIENESLIKILKDANHNIENNTTKKKNGVNQYKTDLYNIIDLILNNTRSVFKGIDIRQKSRAKENPIEAIKLWKGDLIENLELPSDISAEKLESEKKIIINNLENLKSPYTEMTLDLYQDLNESLKKQTPKPKESYSNDVLTWIRKGIDIHEFESDNVSSKEKCKFCGNNFDVESVYAEITQKINAEYSLEIKKLDNFKKIFKSSILSEKVLELLGTEEIETINFIQDVENIIQEKEKDTMRSYEISIEDWNNIISTNNRINELFTDYEERLIEIEKHLAKLEKIAKHQVATAIINNSSIPEYIERINKFESLIREEENILKSNKQVIDDWSIQDSDYTPFKELANKELKYLGLDFKLEVLLSGKGYRLKHTNSDIVLKVKDLSEGERRLLGFIHFYYDLFDNINEDTEIVRNSINTIVIDDPITSFDADNRFLLIEWINNFLKKIINEDIQVFIFTHSSFDFHSFAYGIHEKSNWRIFKNNEGKSQIKNITKHELKNYSDYYKTVFLELAQYALLSKSELEHIENYYVFGNKMRFVLESHARSNYNIENVTSSSISDLYNYYCVRDENKSNFKSAVDLINSLSHGRSYYEEHMSKMSALVLQKKIKSILKVFFEKDPHHVKSMTDDKITTKNTKVW
ncbi:AAA family ATPase [Macrococcoides caseolyticum]|uniref:AAA family ATPase n=1 Tax=Macrococcoides caseolyticum TaxID=69966 RepID=UPI001F254076|nr:AAA family ATPase [Macrococcus caseolyticus]MCE4958051.1 AAA family ATPase [Macrococcus caseolyticus]